MTCCLLHRNRRENTNPGHTDVTRRVALQTAATQWSAASTAVRMRPQLSQRPSGVFTHRKSISFRMPSALLALYG